MSGFKSAWQGLYQRVVDSDPLDLSLLLTLVLILARPGPMDHWYLVIVTSSLAICALVHRPLAREPGFWFLLAAIYSVVHLFLHWEFSDNHKYVITYWTLAIGCSLLLRNPSAALAINGRILVGLVFLFATIWKATTMAYLDDTNFHFLLVADLRFFPIANLLADFSSEMHRANQLGLATIRSLPLEIPLETTPAVPWAAKFLTWWTVILEGVIAIVFLVPRKEWPGGAWAEKWRHVILLGFVLTTYPPTNVIQFGWVILVMAIAACPPEMKRTRFAYFAAFVFIFLFSTGFFRELFYDWITGLDAK